MREEEIINEIISKLSNLKPNGVVSLSDEAGQLLIETVKEMQENGEI